MKKILILILLVVSGNIVLSQTHLIKVKKTYYEINFDTLLKVPVYTYYEYTKQNNVHVVEREPGFHRDSLIDKKFQAMDKDYGRPYDKGHLVPNNDMRFNSVAERENMSYANVAPQWGSMNQVQWRIIENYVGDLGLLYDTLQIYTGCIFGVKYDNITKKIVKTNIQTIGVKNISVPNYYFKTILVKGTNKACGFLCRNMPLDSHDPMMYAVSIDFIETLLGIDLYANYDKKKQAAFEASKIINK